MAQGSAPGADASNPHEWIARASFPEERLNCKAFAFRERQDEVILKSRRDCWHRLFPDASAKRKILERRGLSEAQWNQCMRDVEVTAPEHLPEWAKVFIELHRGWQRHGAQVEAPHLDDKPWLQLSAGWARMCQPWLDAQQAKLAADRIRLTDESVDDLLEYLMVRLGGPVFGVLSSYFPADAARRDDGKAYLTLDFWHAAFDRQPILVKIIGNLTLCWRDSTQEMLQRFAADLPLIAERGLLHPKAQADDETIVSRLPCGLGDPHRGGRSVAIFETDRGDVVYKPKDLIGTRATGELLQALHREHSAFVPLPPDFLYCDGYGWEQRVRHRECERIEQAETFYRRLGGWLFLVQLLNGNDFWYDNLIACGDMPYFIDYETIVGNGFHDYRGWRELEQSEHIEQLWTMAMIGILPMQLPGSTSGALDDGIDISTAAPPGTQRTPFDHGSALAQGPFGAFEARDHALFLRGEHQDMKDFLESFIDGYRHMGALFASRAGRSALQRFQKRIARARFRQIVIDTWQCYSLLHRFFVGCGHDGVRATIALDRYLAVFSQYSPEVAEGIRDDIWRNDVPLFELQTDSTAIFNTAGARSEQAYFKRTAAERIDRNQAYLRTEIDRQVEYIGALFATRPDRPRRNWRRSARPGAPPPTDEGLLALAQEIGDQLATWIGQAETLRDIVALGRLQLAHHIAPSSLSLGVDGCSGILVFLAALQRHAAVGAQHAQAIRKCYEYLITDGGSAADAADIHGYYMQQAAKHCGALSLPGAKLTALCRLAQTDCALGDGPAAQIEDWMRTVLQQMNEADTLFADLRHGVGGLLHRFAELEPIFEDAALAGWIEQVLALVERKPLQVSPEQTDAYRAYADALLPDAAAGTDLVDRYLRARWPDFAQHPGWRKLQHSVAPAQQQKRAAAADRARADNLPTAHSEALIDCAYRLLPAAGGEADRAAFNRVLGELVQRQHDSGRFFPDLWAEDKFLLSAIHGLSDMGLLLLSARSGENLNPFRLTPAD